MTPRSTPAPDVAPATLDELWADMLLDACASDGPIRDADVREAMKRGRPKIEAEARRAAIEEVRRAVEYREHEYLWTWDADTWTEEDMNHAAQMIGDFLGILDMVVSR